MYYCCLLILTKESFCLKTFMVFVPSFREGASLYVHLPPISEVRIKICRHPMLIPCSSPSACKVTYREPLSRRQAEADPLPPILGVVWLHRSQWQTLTRVKAWALVLEGKALLCCHLLSGDSSTRLQGLLCEGMRVDSLSGDHNN